MYKLDLSDNYLLPNQNGSKPKLKESKQIQSTQTKLKQNDSKHMNAIRPYVSKERKNSKREIRASCSPYQLSRSKSKKLQTSNKKIQQPGANSTKQLGDIYHELIALKTQYKNLKSSYNVLAKQKKELTARQQNQKYQLQNCRLQIEKYKKKVQFNESQIDRIKKECFKILESQKFKNKKLEEILQQKQLMIAYLRSENESLKKNKDLSTVSNQNFQRIFFLQNSAPIFSYQSYAKLSANNSTTSANNVLIQPTSQISYHKKTGHKKSQYQEDSLSFSRDRSKQFQSVHSLLSNNNDQTILTFTKKDLVVLDSSSSIKHNNSNSQTVSSGEQNCLTFENRQQKKKHTLKSEICVKRSNKGSKMHTKRLQILTDQINKQYEQGSCQTKKRGQRKKKLTTMKKKQKK